MYLKGNSVINRDLHKAREWLKKAADQGDNMAQEFLLSIN